MRFQRTRNALIQIVIFIAVIVAISALAIWLNLGPVAHSSVGLGTTQSSKASDEKRSTSRHHDGGDDAAARNDRFSVPESIEAAMCLVARSHAIVEPIATNKSTRRPILVIIE